MRISPLIALVVLPFSLLACDAVPTTAPEEAPSFGKLAEFECPDGYVLIHAKIGDPNDKNGNGVVCFNEATGDIVDDGGKGGGNDGKLEEFECPDGYLLTHAKIGDPNDKNGNGAVCFNKATGDIVDDGSKGGGKDGGPAAVKTTGHGTVDLGKEAVMSFSFTALGDAKDARGQFEFHQGSDFSKLNQKFHGEVTCIAADKDVKGGGGVVRFGGVITNAKENAPGEGTEVYWTVVDNGEGANAQPDEMSEPQFGFHKATKIGGSDCAGLFHHGFPIIQGNIQVH